MYSNFRGWKKNFNILSAYGAKILSLIFKALWSQEMKTNFKSMFEVCIDVGVNEWSDFICEWILIK